MIGVVEYGTQIPESLDVVSGVQNQQKVDLQFHN